MELCVDARLNGRDNVRRHLDGSGLALVEIGTSPLEGLGKLYHLRIINVPERHVDRVSTEVGALEGVVSVNTPRPADADGDCL